MEFKFTNRLVQETSPYLLQHAHNPVNWLPWGNEALQKAVAENKMILVSIGYSACHWCHVMEHECFEDEELATIMNEHFICIKVDREERPDIDQIYMNALQLMTGSGGWPLNCFTLPDARPIYAGTYFPKASWKNVLTHLIDLYSNEYDKVIEYADKVTKGIQLTDSIIDKKEPIFLKEDLKEMYKKWEGMMDMVDGGPNRAPKFPLPNNFQFLLRYYYHTKDEELLNYIHLTLTKMARGGIYDQVGGGFARYSVDGYWKVPHFEKMLYDNAQLLSLYSEAYSLSGIEEYKHVVYDTFKFLELELLSPEFGFYSALDADSEGKEGRYYVFTVDELKQILENDFDFAVRYYSIGSNANWEHGKQILVRMKSDEQFATDEDLTVEQLRKKVEFINNKILAYRSKRVRPGLDDKILTSWNTLLNCGLVDAFFAFGDINFLKLAEQNMHFLLNNLEQEDGGLYRNYKNGNSSINGFLDDYTFTIEALLKLFVATANKEYLNKSISLTEYVINHFSDISSAGFFYTSDKDEPLIARKKEWSDNVIPASNSSMAKNLYYLGLIIGKEEWIEMAKNMLMCVKNEMLSYGPGYSNWSILHLHFTYGMKELVVAGNNQMSSVFKIKKLFIPGAFVLPGILSDEYAIFKNRFSSEEDVYYLCENNSCRQISDNIEIVKTILMNNED